MPKVRMEFGVGLISAKVDDLVGGQPVTLVIGAKEFTVCTNTQSVRRAQTRRNDFPVTGRTMHGVKHYAQQAAPVRCVLRIVGIACKTKTLHAGRQRQPHVAFFCDQTKGKIVVVAGHRKTSREWLVKINNVVTIEVNEPGDLGLFGDVYHALMHQDTQRLGQPAGNLGRGYQTRVVLVDVVQYPDTVIDTQYLIPGGHHKATVRHKGYTTDFIVEAGRP